MEYRLSITSYQLLNETESAIKRLQADGAKAIVMDLRGTNGESLQAIRDVTCLFPRKGTPLWLIENTKSGERKLTLNVEIAD